MTHRKSPPVKGCSTSLYGGYRKLVYKKHKKRLKKGSNISKEVIAVNLLNENKPKIYKHNLYIFGLNRRSKGSKTPYETSSKFINILI